MDQARLSHRAGHASNARSSTQIRGLRPLPRLRRPHQPTTSSNLVPRALFSLTADPPPHQPAAPATPAPYPSTFASATSSATSFNSAYQTPQQTASVAPSDSTTIPLPPIPYYTGPQYIKIGASGLWAVAAIIFSSALLVLGSAFLAMLLFIRPVLVRMESALRQMEESMKSMDLAGKSMEKAASTMDRELPVMSEEMRATANEFEVLGRDLTAVTASLTGRKLPPNLPPSRDATKKILVKARGGPLDEEGIALAEKTRFKNKVAARYAEDGAASTSTPGIGLDSADLMSSGEGSDFVITNGGTDVNRLAQNGASSSSTAAASNGNGASARAMQLSNGEQVAVEEDGLIQKSTKAITNATLQVSSSVSSAIAQTTSSSVSGVLSMLRGVTDFLDGSQRQIGRALSVVEGDRERAQNKEAARKWINAWRERNKLPPLPPAAPPRTVTLTSAAGTTIQFTSDAEGADLVARPPPETSYLGLPSSSLPALVYRFTGAEQDEVGVALRRAQEAAEVAAKATGALERALKEVQESNANITYSSDEEGDGAGNNWTKVDSSASKTSKNAPKTGKVSAAKNFKLTKVDAGAEGKGSGNGSGSSSNGNGATQQQQQQNGGPQEGPAPRKPFIDLGFWKF